MTGEIVKNNNDKPLQHMTDRRQVKLVPLHIRFVCVPYSLSEGARIGVWNYPLGHEHVVQYPELQRVQDPAGEEHGGSDGGTIYKNTYSRDETNRTHTTPHHTTPCAHFQHTQMRPKKHVLYCCWLYIRCYACPNDVVHTARLNGTRAISTM